MKKKIILLWIALILLCQSACSGSPSTSAIVPAQLSEEEMEIAILVGGNLEVKLFDYHLKEKPDGMILCVYTWEEGSWKENMRNTYSQPGQEGRLSFDYDRMWEGLSIGFVSKDLKDISSYTPFEKDSLQKEEATVVGASLSESREIEFGEEIPLLLQGMGKSNSLDTYLLEESLAKPELYRETPYDVLYLVTLTFE